MKASTRFLALAMVATFAIAGCGEDNNDNNDNSNPTKTSTPVAGKTATPVAATATPVSATATGAGPTTTAGGPTATPAPGPTVTPTGGDCNGEGAALNVTITSLPGSDLDTGFTGISHNTVATHDNTVTTQLNCTGNNCNVDGTSLVGQAFGSPLPLSSGGISVCVLNSFREAVTGTYDCGSGCSESSAKLLSKVFLVQDADKPCPPCVGDATPNDGVKGGTCDGGKTPGAACDVGGISDLFENATGHPPDAGQTSNDCLPTGSSVGNLNIDLNPLTTGSISVNASVDCLRTSFPAGSCFCPSQVQPNSCNSGECPASGICEGGPIDAICTGQIFRQCRPGTGTEDCDDIFPGAGTCVDQPRPCFGTNISRQGVCGTQQGTLVSFFCVPATSAAAINTTAGLPGPGAVTLPVSQVRTPR